MFSQQYQVHFDEEMLSQIHSVEFINSICVIHKARAQDNVLGERIIIGEEELVASNVKAYHHSHGTALDQRHNIWSYLPEAGEAVASIRPALEAHQEVQHLAHLGAVGYLQQMVVLQLAARQAEERMAEAMRVQQALEQKAADSTHETMRLLAELAARNADLTALRADMESTLALKLAFSKAEEQLADAQTQLAIWSISVTF